MYVCNHCVIFNQIFEIFVWRFYVSVMTVQSLQYSCRCIRYNLPAPVRTQSAPQALCTTPVYKSFIYSS